ncbi:MAG: hypothetical protein HY240_07175 [Actinobacteria bacterium]|nr:hypothetical protein [Actinomycetota bacterium]
MSHTRSADPISRKPRQIAARARSAATMSRRRSSRSASTPATGENRKYVSSWAARTSPTAMADPERS